MIIRTPARTTVKLLEEEKKIWRHYCTVVELQEETVGSLSWNTPLSLIPEF